MFHLRSAVSHWLAALIVLAAACAQGTSTDFDDDSDDGGDGGSAAQTTTSTGAQPGAGGSGTCAPAAPYGPLPMDGALDVNSSTVTSVDFADASNAVSYAVFFSDTCPPPAYPNALFTPTTTSARSGLVLQPSTSYCWQAVSIDAEGCSTPGPVWEFTTACDDPMPGPPTVTSGDITFGPGNGVYRLTFSEDVFDVTPNVTWTAVTGSGTLDSVTAVDGSTYDISFSGTADGDSYTITVGPPIADVCAAELAAPTTITLSIMDFGCDLLEEFSTTTFPPNQWIVTDGGGSTDTWFRCDNVTCFADDFWSTTFTLSDGAFAAVDSDAAGITDMLEDLELPQLTCTSATSVNLSFVHAFNQLGGDSGQVQLSANGGAWTTVASYDADTDLTAGEAVSLDISAQAAGQSNVRVRFRYTANYDWHWLIDTVSITSAP